MITANDAYELTQLAIDKHNAIRDKHVNELIIKLESNIRSAAACRQTQVKYHSKYSIEVNELAAIAFEEHAFKVVLGKYNELVGESEFIISWDDVKPKSIYDDSDSW